jgi:hypothetical protein
VQAESPRRLQLRLPPPGPSTAAAALLVGVTGDYLLRGGAWGVSFAIWIGLAIAAATVTAPNPRDRGICAAELAPALVCALGLAVRDSPMLRAWNACGAALWLVVPVVRRSGAGIAAARIGDFAAGALRAARGSLSGPVVHGEPSGAAAPGREAAGSGRALAMGGALAVALLIVFGGLLRSADAAFERAIGLVWRWDLDVASSHLALIAVLTWVALGYLTTIRTDTRPVALERPVALGVLEFALPLLALSALFLAFDVVQLQYVVGGAAFVRDALGLTFAEHARRGFFQLIATTALTLAVLLAAAWTVRAEDEAARRVLRRAGVLVLVAVAPIPVSAFWRLGLYVEAYGLTEIRLYSSAIMVWLVFCLAWLGPTVLRRAPRRFAFGSWVAGFVTLLALDAVNPDALIAKVNLDRARRGAALDTAYLGRLSADAVPGILGRAGEIDAATRCALVARWSSGGEDWRSWNVGTARARAAARSTPRCD